MGGPIGKTRMKILALQMTKSYSGSENNVCLFINFYFLLFLEKKHKNVADMNAEK